MSREGPGGGGRAAWVVASVGGVGTLRPAPGSWGSLVAAVAGAGLVGHPLWLGGGVAAAGLAGLWAIPRAGGGHDPGWVVIDEVAGQWLAMLGLVGWGAHGGAGGVPGWGAGWRSGWGAGWDPAWGMVAGVAAAFALFRVFDVLKPGPVGWADRREGAGWVMGDDLIAGGMAAGVLLAARAMAGWAFGGG